MRCVLPTSESAIALPRLVECKASEEMDYPAFCNEHAIEVDNVELLPYMDRDSGEPWTTEEGKPWFGLVRPKTA